MPDTVHSIVYYFAVQLKKLLGTKLTKVILYGSYARGDYRENSDVDIMILTTMSEDEIRKTANAIYDIAFDIELEKGIHISAVIKNENQYAYWVDTLPFYKNIQKEGLEISAE